MYKHILILPLFAFLASCGANEPGSISWYHQTSWIEVTAYYRQQCQDSIYLQETGDDFDLCVKDKIAHIRKRALEQDKEIIRDISGEIRDTRGIGVIPIPPRTQ